MQSVGLCFNFSVTKPVTLYHCYTVKYSHSVGYADTVAVSFEFQDC